jgi:hypothetical protein
MNYRCILKKYWKLGNYIKLFKINLELAEPEKTERYLDLITKLKE